MRDGIAALVEHESPVRKLRERYKLTQAKLSEITGIPMRTIGNWETGCREAPLYMIGLIEAKIELEILKNSLMKMNSRS